MSRKTLQLSEEQKRAMKELIKDMPVYMPELFTMRIANDNLD